MIGVITQVWFVLCSILTLLKGRPFYKNNKLDGSKAHKRVNTRLHIPFTHAFSALHCGFLAMTLVGSNQGK
jgi:hypothetical protein